MLASIDRAGQSTHVRVQRAIDDLYARGELSEPAATEFVCWIHRAFYDGAPEAMLRIERNDGTDYSMVQGDLRQESFQDNVVGRHRPPSSSVVGGFMAYFEEQFRLAGLGAASKVAA